MEAWNQWAADNRHIDIMRRVALDALQFEDADDF